MNAAAQAPDSTELRQFHRAESLLDSGQTEEAIGLLESLYDAAPGYDAFYQTLKEAYEQTKQYDAAIELVNDRIDAQATPTLVAEKGRLLYQNGQRERASATWDEALALRPEELSTYRGVYQTLMDLRLFSEAIDVLTKGRSVLDRPGLFRTDLAYLYSLDGQHGRAMQEYVALLAESPDRVNYVRERLQSFVDREEGLSTGIEVLQSAVENRPSNTGYYRLLAWLHMQTDDYAAAFDAVREVDQLQERQGRALISFARQAADAERYDVATKAYEAVLDRHADRSVAPQARKGLGDMYRRWADRGADSPALVDTSGARARRYDAARTAYRTFLDEYPDHEAVSDVRIALGTLQLDVYRDLKAAETTFRDVMEEASGDDSSTQAAALHLGRIALLRDAFEQARRRFSRLAGAHPDSDPGREAQLELARLNFYQGDFDAALERAQSIATRTSADGSNDAIDLKVLIQENRGPDSLDSALRLYAQAQLAERKRTHEAASAHLDSLLHTHSRHSLADEARFRRAHVYLARGDTSAALQAFDDLSRQHPSSPYADRSLFRHAQLQEAQGDLEAATSAYDRLLTEYPQSLLAGDARTRLRSLRRQRG